MSSHKRKHEEDASAYPKRACIHSIPNFQSGTKRKVLGEDATDYAGMKRSKTFHSGPRRDQAKRKPLERYELDCEIAPKRPHLSMKNEPQNPGPVSYQEAEQLLRERAVLWCCYNGLEYSPIHESVLSEIYA